MSTPRRRGAAWVSLGRGVRRAAADAGLASDLVAWQEVLPRSAVFTHLTAAAMHRLWVPPLPEDLPLFVAVPTSAARPRRPQLVVTRHPAVPEHVEVDGARVATVAETLVGCARDLRLLDLVVLLDSALHLDRVTRSEIVTVCRRRHRGSRRLREALAFADARSESPWESVLRMFHLAVGAPVEPQVRIVDPDGVFVARADLLVRGTRHVHEYDGAGHRDARQHRADLRRERALLAAGYSRRGYSADDVRWRPHDLLKDIDAALGRPRDPSRLEPWAALWRESLFSLEGTRLLRERWGLGVEEQEPDLFDRVGPDPFQQGRVQIW
jgi:very-short-patch-repair endonuclease